MTSSNDQVRTAMRAYADTLEPPPLADVIARAEQPPASRRNGRLVMAAALIVAAVASSTFAISSLTNDTPGPPAATQPTGGPGFAAPGCPPGMPTLDNALTGGKPPIIKPGRTVTIRMRMPTTLPDRRLRTFAVSLVPADARMSPSWPVVARSAVIKLTPDQKTVDVVIKVPGNVARGKYNVIGIATWPAPSVCGHVNPPGTTLLGTIEGGIGSVVVG